MEGWKLLTIEHGCRVTEVQYSQGGLSGFSTRTKKNHHIVSFRTRERLGDLLRSLARLIDHRDVDVALRIAVVKIADRVDAGAVANENDQGFSVDGAVEPVAVSSEESGSSDFHLDVIGPLAKVGKKVFIYI